MGILAASGFAVYSQARKAARVSKRIQDLQALRTAVETYKSANGFYPSHTAANSFTCIGNVLTTPLVSGYMSVLPADPLDSGDPNGTNCYEYASNQASPTTSTEYKIRTKASIYGVSGEMDSAAFGQQRTLIDPARDGEGTANCTVVSGGTYTGWAVYSGTAICSL